MTYPPRRRRLTVWLRSATVLALASTATGAAAVESDIPTRELDPNFAATREGFPYTLAMLELGMRMGAANTEALRANDERALASLEQFRRQYEKVAAMVPSWKMYFPAAPLDDLKTALEGKRDASAKREAIDRIEKSCTNCHVRYMFPVQARYRWGKFSAAQVQGDRPEAVSFHQIMLDIANRLGAIRGDVRAGRFDEARSDYDQLRDRFTLMELVCTNCHEQPREYFIDARVKGRLLKLGGLLRKGETNVSDYNTILNDINTLSCLPCHQVHMPAAFLQEFWRRQKP